VECRVEGGATVNMATEWLDSRIVDDTSPFSLVDTEASPD